MGEGMNEVGARYSESAPPGCIPHVFLTYLSMDWIAGLVPGLIPVHGPFSVILGDIIMSIIPDSNEPNPQGDLTPPAEAPGPRPAPLPAQSTVTDMPRLQVSVCAVGAALV